MYLLVSGRVSVQRVLGARTVNFEPGINATEKENLQSDNIDKRKGDFYTYT